ncbi:MAG TPA: type II and III secretion system protein [Pyrinomonadaceae bacterium]
MKKHLFLIILLFIPFGVCAQPVQQSPAPTQPTNASRQQPANVCDPTYKGELISFSMTTQLTLETLVDQIHRRFGVNFLMGEGVKNLPIDIISGSLPWKTMLDSQLYLSGVSTKCVNNNTLLLVQSDKRKRLDDQQFNSGELRTEFIKLKYLQPTSSGTQDLAGRTTQSSSSQGCQSNQGGGGGGNGSGGGNNSQECGNFEKLKYEIENILGLHDSKNVLLPASNADNNGSYGDVQTVQAARTGAVAVIPGRNIFVIRGTEDQLELIKQFIALADRPPFQVIIKGLVYTANIDRLTDIGVQSVLIDGKTVPGEVKPKGTFLAFSPLSGLFDFSTLIGTVDFNIQASALQKNGIISIKARPFAIVLDGDPTELEVGRQIPVLTQGSVNGGDAGALEFIGATNKLAVVPHVMDDDNGNPVAVNLEMLLQSNEVDTTVVSQGIPTVNERSIQSRFILTQDKTVILGGFTVDSTNDSVSKIPGLGDLPILGYLFKRRVRTDQVTRLYFALSVTVVPYGQVLEPVKVPGATTDVPEVKPSVTRTEKKLETKDQ